MNLLKSLIIIPLLLWATTSMAYDIPKLEGRVTDTTHAISADDLTHLNKRLSDLEKNEVSHPQIAYLIINKVPEEGIEQYANDVARTWGIGHKGSDNGILVVLALGSHKSRMEVGYGMEPYITDATSKTILDSARPNLRIKDWTGAIDTITTGILGKLPTPKDVGAAEPTTQETVQTPVVAGPLEGPGPKKTEGDDDMAAIFIFGGMFVFAAIALATALARREKKYSSTFLPQTHEPTAPTKPHGFNSGFVTGAVTGALLDNALHPRPRRTYDDDSTKSSLGNSSDSSYSSSSLDSDSDGARVSSDSFSGGGGDFGGGGSSSDW